MWLILRQLPMKAGCWNAPFALRVLAMSNLSQFPSFFSWHHLHTTSWSLSSIVFTRQFRGSKWEYIWLLQEIEPGLPRWEFDVTTAMHFLMAPQQSRTGLGHNLLSRCCTRHFSLSHRAPIHSRIRPLGGQGRHFWQMVRQLPMKTGWWDASLALRDLAMSNLHDIFRWLETEHWPEMG